MRIPQTVAYVLRSFPQPSETFVADEILSVLNNDIRVFALLVQQGADSIVHPSAAEVIKHVELYRLGGVPIVKSLLALLWFLVRAPVRTLRTIFMAIRHRARWCYVQSLPAAKWCVRNRVEFLHAHFADSNFLYASAIAAWSGIPYGVTTHRYDILNDPLPPTQVTPLFHAASLLITVSYFNRSYMAQKYSVSLDRIQVVRCGIDLDRFSYVEKRSSISGRKIRILNVGRLVPIKGHDILLSAMQIVKERGVPFVLEIIGGGELRRGLEKMAGELGIANAIIFHGTRPEAFVRERLAAADVFVLSSRSEGLPVVCMEALAMGTPVIATRIFGIPELIQHRISGTLVSPDAPGELADAICSVYNEPSQLESMRVAGREAVQAEFERAQCTKQLIGLWAQALNRNRGKNNVRRH